MDKYLSLNSHHVTSRKRFLQLFIRVFEFGRLKFLLTHIFEAKCIRNNKHAITYRPSRIMSLFCVSEDEVREKNPFEIKGVLEVWS